MKLLSLIIPLYNSAQWVEKCLDSVLNQDVSMEQMEVICINDGSPDNSSEIVRGKSEEVRLKNGYSPIVVLDQENQGPSGARNNGMRHATGKYLMFVDPDDYVEPHTIGGLIAQMEREHLDMLRFNFQMVNERYEIIDKPLAEKLFDYTPEQMSGAEFIGKRLDGACNIWRYIYRTEIIIKNEIWCYTGDYFDDTPWLPLVLLKAEKMNISNTIVYDYLERSDSLVKSVSEKSVQKKIDGYFFLLKTLKEQYEKINCSEQWRQGVMGWYRLMMGYSVLNLLSLIAIHRFKERHQLIRRVQTLELFPVDYHRMIPKMQRKAKLANIHPWVLVDLMHIRNK